MENDGAGAVVVVPHAVALLSLNVIELLEKCAEHCDWLKRYKSNQGFLLQIKLTSHFWGHICKSKRKQFRDLPDGDFNDRSSSFRWQAHFLF